ncbi:MAG: hypothetical protein IIC73_01970, partial [Armatimonadetes bacterium]|nr:hypothetical protein [Armatimonadota bacterium]
DVARAVKNAMDVWLGSISTNQMGQPMSFAGVVEEQMKLGALMSTSAIVTWKTDVPGGRVSVDTVDPRSVWIDHTGRGLYRIRRIEIDKHELIRMAKEKDSAGNNIFNLEEIEKLSGMILEETQRGLEASTGHGQEITSIRKPVVLHEYLATVLSNDGKVVEENKLFIVANNSVLIRGPEKNPFWHGKDWLVTTPLVSVPLSPYGRSYVEDFGSLANTFNELTNMILDAVFVSSMKSFAIIPSMLMNPQQAAEGMFPNKLWLLEDGQRAQDFMKEIDLGTLDPASIQIWQTLKNELTEAAAQNEVGLGQFAPKGRTSATEVLETKEGASALIRSIAENVETRLFNPMLDLIWKTGFQHVGKGDTAIARAMGPEMFTSLLARRKEMVTKPFTFSARGISTLLQKSRKLRTLLFALQTMSSNELLMKSFLERIDTGKLAEVILELLDIDLSKLQLSERERQIRGVVDMANQRQGQAEAAVGGKQASDGTKREASEAAKLVQGLGTA